VMKPNLMVSPLWRNHPSNSMPLISGMVQSDNTRSGLCFRMASTASFPFSASTIDDLRRRLGAACASQSCALLWNRRQSECSWRGPSCVNAGYGSILDSIKGAPEFLGFSDTSPRPRPCSPVDEAADPPVSRRFLSPSCVLPALFSHLDPHSVACAQNR
jgi:hypothetical protein